MRRCTAKKPVKSVFFENRDAENFQNLTEAHFLPESFFGNGCHLLPPAAAEKRQNHAQRTREN
jgi:hypothetical protein